MISVHDNMIKSDLGFFRSFFLIEKNAVTVCLKIKIINCSVKKQKGFFYDK